MMAWAMTPNGLACSEPGPDGISVHHEEMDAATLKRVSLPCGLQTSRKMCADE